MNELEISSAIATHEAWARKFEQAILGIDADQLAQLHVSDHTKCELGFWLVSTGKLKYEGMPLYEELVITHKTFHSVAQQIIDLLLEAKVDEADYLLTTQLKELSSHTTILLNRLKVVMQD